MNSNFNSAIWELSFVLFSILTVSSWARPGLFFFFFLNEKVKPGDNERNIEVIHTLISKLIS